MNKITKHVTRAMRPAAALIAYICEDDYFRKEYHLEFRKIGKNGIMGAGKPVSKKFVQSLVENFTVESSSVPHGEVPRKLLFIHTRKDKYVWYTPTCRKYLYFTSNLNIPNDEYHIPGLVWVVEGESLNLFAYKAKQLNSDSQLYSAPFFNVNSLNGSVCLGNAKIFVPGRNSFDVFIQCWEDRFFLSKFSHVSGGNPTKTNLVLVTLNSLKSFDNTELKPIKKLKLKNLFE
jgi:PRTRC genetic system protein B